MTRTALLTISFAIAGCSAETPLPALPTSSDVNLSASRTAALLGPSFKPIFVCGSSLGKSLRTEGKAVIWDNAAEERSTILAIDHDGRLDVLHSAGRELVAASTEGGLVIPTQFDPVAGSASVTVVFPVSGKSRTYRFSAPDESTPILIVTTNNPTIQKENGNLIAEISVSQCVELPIML